MNNQPVFHYLPKALSADGLVKSGGGFMKGFIVASGSGTMKLWDNTAASGTVILDTISVIGTDSFEMPVEFKTGLYFNLVSGTLSVTILYI